MKDSASFILLGYGCLPAAGQGADALHVALDDISSKTHTLYYQDLL